MNAPAVRPRGRGGGPWRQAAYASLDFETTGLDLAGDDIISFGVVPIEKGRILPGRSMYREVRPDRPLKPASIAVHGLRPVDLEEASTLGVVVGDLRDALAGRYVLAWAAQIEAAFLARVFGRRTSWWRKQIIDVLRLALLVDGYGAGGHRDFSLTAVAGRLGVPVERPHHALDDALTTAQVFLVLLPDLERRGITTPRRLVRAGRGSGVGS
jgi:DNA polymerase-3 subunit epsilon